MGREWYRNPALRVRLECQYWTWGDCSETWIDKETKPKWCGSKSPPGQGERLQLWILLLRNMECDGDRDDLGGPKGLCRAKSWNFFTSILSNTTNLILSFLDCYSFSKSTQEDTLGLHCHRNSSPNCSVSVIDDFVVLALAMSMVTIDYRTTKWVRPGNRASISAQAYFALLTVLMDPKHIGTAHWYWLWDGKQTYKKLCFYNNRLKNNVFPGFSVQSKASIYIKDCASFNYFLEGREGGCDLSKWVKCPQISHFFL